jgi:hypothetical protein
VEITLRSWFSAWVRALWALVRARRRTLMDSTFPALRLPVGLARLSGACRRDGVEGIGLAPPPARLAVGPVDLHHGDAVVEQVARESCAVRTGALDTDPFDLAEAPQPGEQPAVAGGGGRERLDAEQPADGAEHGSDVDVEVGVDPADDAIWHGGHRHPSFVGEVGWPTSRNLSIPRLAGHLH